jgi:hypothetical protein
MSLRKNSLALLAGLGLFALLPGTGMAQLTVQQPVFGVNSVSTTVSVPDRGRAHLGSISRARDSRVNFGPFRPGTNTGLDREHSGMSVGVYIHNFEAMDQYLLNQGTNASAGSRLSGNAGHAWNQLQARQGTRPSAPQPTANSVSQSEKFWRLGHSAERKGNLTVARLHYRIASKHGSQAATARLAQWNDSDAPEKVATAAQ